MVQKSCTILIWWKYPIVYKGFHACQVVGRKGFLVAINSYEQSETPTCVTLGKIQRLRKLVFLVGGWWVHLSPLQLVVVKGDLLDLGGIKLGQKNWSGWWFQRFFVFHPYLRKWSNLTKYFSIGLKPPTSLVPVTLWHLAYLSKPNICRNHKRSSRLEAAESVAMLFSLEVPTHLYQLQWVGPTKTSYK